MNGDVGAVKIIHRLTHQEQNWKDPDMSRRILSTDIASYTFPVGWRLRYTAAGWVKAKAIGIAKLRAEDFTNEELDEALRRGIGASQLGDEA